VTPNEKDHLDPLRSYRTLGTFARPCVARASRIAVMTNVWISMPFCKQ